MLRTNQLHIRYLLWPVAEAIHVQDIVGFVPDTGNAKTLQSPSHFML
jgi:hypothetical protein